MRLPRIYQETFLPAGWSYASRLLVPLLMALNLTGVSPAMAGVQPSKPGGASNPALLYHNYCSVCHGDKGDGRSRAQGSLVPPPRDFTSPGATVELTRERMISGVKYGRPGTAMTPWDTQLNDKEIEAVVDYIRNTLMLAASSSGSGRGRVVYAKNCSVCHGDKGDGNTWAKSQMQPPPRDFSSAQAKADFTRERLITSITYGRPDTAMAGFGSQLSKDDINAVADYIRNVFMAGSTPKGASGIYARGEQSGSGTKLPVALTSVPKNDPTNVDMSALMPKKLKGDPEKGAGFYMSNCATCHGVTGDGRGPRAYFINPKPRDFLHTASRQKFNRPALFDAIALGKRGTEMPAWNKVLDDQEIANIAEFVFRQFILPGVEKTQREKSSKK